jgi:peptide/nickel transport system substrate-binding protein
MRKGFVTAIASVILLALFLGACGPEAPTPVETGGTNGGSETPVKGGQIVFGMTGDPVIFNPILSTDVPSGNINSRVYSSLVRANENMEPIGDLAKEWSVSEDGLVWTFKLRDDVYWHDGTKFTSADVKYTYEAIKHPDYLGIRATDFKPITKVEAPDDYTIELHLDEPYAPILSKLVIGIIPKHIFEEYEIGKMKECPANMEPIGTGPWKFVTWEKGQYIMLEANENYYGEGPYIEKIIWKFYGDNQVMLAALENGDIDYMGAIPPDDVARIQEALSETHDIRPVTQNGYTYIGLKQTDPILKDKFVRQALMYGTNRQQIVDHVLMGYGEIMNANIPRLSWAYAGDELNPYEYNPEKAKELLDQAGWKVGADGIREKDGMKMDVKLLTSTGNKVLEAALLIVQQNWKDLGVNVEVEYIEWAVLCEQYLDVAKFQSYALGWSLGIDPDFYLFFHSDAAVNEQGQLVGFNDVEFKNERLDELLELGRTEMDQEERKRIYIEAQKIVNEELPYVFLYASSSPAAMHKKVQGVTWGYAGPMFPELWWIKEAGE